MTSSTKRNFAVVLLIVGALLSLAAGLLGLVVRHELANLGDELMPGAAASRTLDEGAALDVCAGCDIPIGEAVGGTEGHELDAEVVLGLLPYCHCGVSSFPSLCATEINFQITRTMLY